MERKEMKRIIDTELNEIVFTDIMKKKVFENSKRRISHSILRYAAIFALTFMIGGTTVFAGYYFLNKVNVNKMTLPELDAMQIVEITPLKAEKDEYGYIYTEFSDYTALQSNIGIDLLESKYATEQFYLQGSMETDRKNYAIIKMKNYITEEMYYSPISLSMDLILSQEQLEQGWDTDYLGFYEYVESYKIGRAHV